MTSANRSSPAPTPLSIHRLLLVDHNKSVGPCNCVLHLVRRRRIPICREAERLIRDKSDGLVLLPPTTLFAYINRYHTFGPTECIYNNGIRLLNNGRWRFAIKLKNTQHSRRHRCLVLMSLRTRVEHTKDDYTVEYIPSKVRYRPTRTE